VHQLALPLLIGLIVVALSFDFLNGLHDAANSIATVVGTRLLSPVGAVAFAAFFNFAAYFLALKWPSLHNVADTIGKGLIDKDLVTPAVVFGALVGAMFWNIVTWVKGIPSSSSHALVGGIVGAGVAHAGFPSIQWVGLNKTLIAIVASPVLGLILTMAIMLLTSWLGVRATARGAERTFRGLHLLSSGTLSLSHGLNDAQKTMGLITVLLYSTGYLQGKFAVPNWVALSCYIAMGLGTLTGGWRIIETMGTRITKLSQHQGFSASAGGFDDAYRDGLRDRRGGGAACLRCAVGDRRRRRDGVGDHNPRLGDGGGAVLLADQRRFPALRNRRRDHCLRVVLGTGLADPDLSGNCAWPARI
jgi:PiT family inorganic phosphate transporter